MRQTITVDINVPSREDFMDVVEQETRKLRADLIRRNPVDTGEMKGSWTFLQTTPNGFHFGNTADHADIIALGRRRLGNRWYGSIQGFGNAGIAPVLLRTELEIARRLNDQS